MLLRLFMAVSALLVCCIAWAQERLPNQGTQAIIRTWPKAGVWEVALARIVDGGLGCLLLTAHANQASGERYFWGIRQREGSVGATIIDNNGHAIEGPSILILIDQVPLGAYQISKRINNANGFRNVVAELPPKDSNSLLNLIKVGGAMQFVTSTATYSASLQGGSQALQNFSACLVEAEHLNAASATQKGQ